MKARSLFVALTCGLASTAAVASAATLVNDDALKFDPQAYTEQVLTLPDGKTVNYRAYEHIYYVTNVEDSAYQYLNFFVPEAVYTSENQDVPIFLKNNVGGYRAGNPGGVSGSSATGRALAEGYCVCIPGARGSNSTVEVKVSKKKTETVYTGRAPAGLLDLKAAVRYLRYNDALMPGSAELIITDGTSAGGAMSSLQGATGNHPIYDAYLEAMGAAPAGDDIFAAVCYCPITDLDHADAAYEWLYQCTNTGVRGLSEEQQAVSAELAALYPAYLNSLELKMADGTPITDENYLDYVKSFIMKSAQRAKNEMVSIPDTIGIVFNKPEFGGMPGGMRGGRGPGQGGQPGGPQGDRAPQAGQAPQGAPQGMGPGQGGQRPPQGGPDGQQPQGERPQGMGPGQEGGMPAAMMAMMRNMQGDFVIDVDMNTYLSYVAGRQKLKSPPAFDTQNVIGGRASAENDVFGDAEGNSYNFTDYSLSRANGTESTIDEEMATRVFMMNPMNFIADEQATKAKHWYIRHGARDRDTSFCISVNLATKLMNNGFDVNFFLPWDRPHSGDYNLDDLFCWIAQITK